MADVDLSTLRGSVSPAGELVLDDVARVRAHNDAARTLLSASAEALDGAPFATLLTASTRFFLQTHVFPALSLNGRVDEVYVTLAAFDGTRVPVILRGAIRGSTILSVEGARVGLALVPRDPKPRGHACRPAPRGASRRAFRTYPA